MVKVCSTFGKRWAKIFCTIVAGLFPFFVAGCSSSLQPLEESHQMIPIGENNQWTYVVHDLDSTGRVMAEPTRTITLLPNFYESGRYPVYQWDSSAKFWVTSTVQNGNQFISGENGNWDNFESWSDNFTFAPFSDGTESGLICGDAFEGSLGERFWFKLPDKPVTRLSFNATLFLGYPTDTAVYHAFLDTALFSVTVPAGSFQCYKLVFRFDGQNGNLRSNPDSVVTIDTMYLTPGKGVIKRVIIRTNKSLPVFSTDWTVEHYPTEVYELSSFTIQ